MVSKGEKQKRDKREKFQVGCPYRIGAEILTSAKWFELGKQVRSEDETHTEFVNRMYHFDRITIGDLQRYEFLRASDFDPREPGGSWYDAPYVVCTNRERYTLIHSVAQQFARAHSKVIIRWFTNATSWQQRPAERFMPEVLRDPCFYEYFVPESLGYVKDQGVSKRLGLVNSLPFQYHSIVPQSEDEETYHRQLHEAQPGDIITLPNPPQVVNIEIGEKVQEHFSEKQLRILHNHSIVPDAIVLPVCPGGTKEKEDVPIPGGSGYEPSRVTIRGVFPLEPGFSMTVNKAEGRTLKRVVLCLSHHSEAKTNWDRRGIYVAFSRVRCACDIRLLLHGHTNLEKWESVAYIVDLFEDHTTRSFFVAYGRRPGMPANHNWKTNKWNKRFAYDTYKNMVQQSK